MRILNDRPWLRLPLSLLAAGVVVLALTIGLRLGWAPYAVGLVLLAAGVAVLQHGERDGSRARERGIGVFLAVVLGGAWLLHPQGWHAPGWTMTGAHDQVVGRYGQDVVLSNAGMLSAHDLRDGRLLWRHYRPGQVAVQGPVVLVQEAGHPAKARALSVSTGRHEAPRAWPTGTPAAPVTGAEVHSGRYSADLRTARDLAGDRWTDLVVDGPQGTSSYRVSGVRSLALYDGVLLLEGSRTRVLSLVGL